MLAPKEIYINFSNSYDTSTDLTRQLDYYAVQGVTVNSNSGAIKKNGTSDLMWWYRTADPYYDSSFIGEGTTGSYIRSDYANSANGVSPAFRIG